jgi:hypothetical protein
MRWRAVLLQVLLLFKTNDCLRHLDRILGAPVNTAVIIAQVCAEVILQSELKAKDSSWLQKIRALLRYIHVMLRIILFRAYISLQPV